MRYSILILLSLISIYTFSNEAIYNGNISVAGSEFFEGYNSSEPGIYLGGSNAFPIGTYVEVKMNHTNVSASIKIVRKMAENGKFILVDKSAGEKLGLSDDDTVMVSIIVKKVIPDPSLALDSLEFDPEPEIKGATSRILESEDSEEIVDSTIKSLNESEVTNNEVVNETTDLEAISEDALEPIESDETSDDISTTEDLSEDLENLDDTPEGVTESEEVVEEPTEPNIISEEIGTEESEDLIDDLSLTEEVAEDLDMVEDSLYELGEDSEESIENPSMENKIVKRIFYLEPANKKPPVGGKADKELLPVTREDNKTPFIEGHYLQVGIYSTKERLLDGVEKLETYNIPYEEVQMVDGDKKYILLAGPLLNDEIGVVRLYLKDRGFNDFFRYIKK